MMLTPTYLTTNPSEECPRADHALFGAIDIKLLSMSKLGHMGIHESIVSPFAWQSNKAIRFYFTQNSVSKI